jgi:PKD repeat protein
LTVTFASAADGQAHWDFGNGTMSQETNPTHVFHKAGLYRVTLTVTDAEGRSAQAFQTIAVEQEVTAPLLRVGLPEGHESPGVTLEGTARRGSDGSFHLPDGEPWGWVQVGHGPLDEVRQLRSFTVMGWLKPESLEVGSGGNRILFCLKGSGSGIDLVCHRDGRLRLAVNEWPDSVNNDSSPGKLQVGKWTFFAVSYNAMTSEDNVTWYFSEPLDAPKSSAIRLDRRTSYNAGPVGSDIGALVVGNFNETMRSYGLDRQFRGEIRNLQLFGSHVGSRGALEADEIASQSGQTLQPAANAIVPVKVTQNTGLTRLKPRLVVLTDIAPNNVEPDDMESMIRLLVHADLYEIEALIHSTGWSVWSNAGDTGLNLITEAIDLYEKDVPNLMKRSSQQGYRHDNEHQEIGYWPSADYLRSRTSLGSKNRGQQYIGANNHSDGSHRIIELADERDDDRPIWVTVWGGGNTLAQAIWQVQQERSEEALKAFLHKLRVYTITDQDAAQKRGNVVNWPESSHQWMRREFDKDLLFIWDESAWLYQNGTGRSRWHEYQTHIQGHGNLGNRYPKYKYGVEGDTPAFLHLMPTGLNDPDVPNQVGWGGYFEWGRCRDNATNAYQNHDGSAKGTSSKYQQYFYQATFNNFAARMDWAKDGTGNRNPIVVINDNEGIDIMTFKSWPGTKVMLDASKTSDPDEDKLTFKWWILSEAGIYTNDVHIANSNTSCATVDVPLDSAGKSFHVICEVTDNGTHHLSAYRRIIFEPTDH